MTRARFLPEAEEEFSEAVQFYEKAEVDWARRSPSRLNAPWNESAHFPNPEPSSAHRVAGESRQLSVLGDLSADGDEVTIIAIAHQRRKPVIGEKGKVRPANNTLERTVKHRGRIVLGTDCVLADAQRRL